MNDERDPVTGRFREGHGKNGGRAKGTPNAINKTVKQAMIEAADLLGGKKGAVGVFEQAGEKDIVAFANMLTRHLPLEINADVNNVGCYGDIIVNLIPRGHGQCPDGLYRPNDECAKLWVEHRLKYPNGSPLIDGATGLQVEPEIALLIEKATKSKRDDDKQP